MIRDLIAWEEGELSFNALSDRHDKDEVEGTMKMYGLFNQIAAQEFSPPTATQVESLLADLPDRPARRPAHLSFRWNGARRLAAIVTSILMTGGVAYAAGYAPVREAVDSVVRGVTSLFDGTGNRDGSKEGPAPTNGHVSDREDADGNVPPGAPGTEDHSASGGDPSDDDHSADRGDKDQSDGDRGDDGGSDTIDDNDETDDGDDGIGDDVDDDDIDDDGTEDGGGDDGGGDEDGGDEDDGDDGGTDDSGEDDTDVNEDEDDGSDDDIDNPDNNDDETENDGDEESLNQD